MQIANCKLPIEAAVLTRCRLLADPPAAGAWNMAVDEALLHAAADEGSASLRFYEWSEPTLSLGYFQKYADRERHAASQQCAIVRRQSGGGAILHDRELTYSITLPGNHPLARNAEQLYCVVHAAFVDVLHPKIDASGRNLSLKIRDTGSTRHSREEPFLCFQRSAKGDVVLVDRSEKSSTPAAKILGSAQRRLRGAILQHGSLLLGTSRAAPELVGINELTGLRVSIAELTEVLTRRLAPLLGADLDRSPFSHKLRLAADLHVQQKYNSPAWNMRR